MHERTLKKYQKFGQQLSTMHEAIEERTTYHEPPINIEVGVIKAVQEKQRCETNKVQKIFQGSGLKVKDADWSSLIVPSGRYYEYRTDAYLEEEQKDKQRRLKRGIEEPSLEQLKEAQALHAAKNNEKIV